MKSLREIETDCGLAKREGDCREIEEKLQRDCREIEEGLNELFERS